MSRSCTRAAALLVAVLAFPAFAAGPDSTYEARIDSALRARDARAESLFAAANAALAAKNASLAADLFARVLQRVPDFAPATRRLAYSHLQLKNRSVAVELLDSLLTRDSTAFSRSALAGALVDHDQGTFPPEADVRRARALVFAAIAEAPDEPSVWTSAWEVALAHDPPDTTLLRRTALAMVRLLPGEWGAWLPLVQYGLFTDQPKVVSAALARAHALGMPPELEQQVVAYAAQRRGEHDRAIAMWAGVWLLVGWAVAFAALFAIGAGLSRAALRAASRSVGSATGEATGLDARLRQAYRVVLWGSGAFFYASMPLLLVVVLAVGGGLVYLMFSIGHVPVKLVFIVVLITGATALAILRGLFARYKDEDPGPKADLAAHPRLRATLDLVAGHIGTRPVDTVFLTPGTEVAVFERGGLRRQLQGHAERCLILGIGVLDGMTQRQLKSILAHEYGHFSNRDTAGGGLALSVRRSLMSIAMGIAQGGAAAWYNPAWLFLRAFHAVFMRISQGASRLQEVLADRWAAAAYGSLAFEQGLTHVIATSVRFDARVNRTIHEVLNEKKPLPNLYRYRPAASTEAETEEEAGVAKALDAEPTPYDSHPAPRQRLDWVRGYASPGLPVEAGDDEPAWNLLEGREALEEAMTAETRANVEARYDVKFATG